MKKFKILLVMCLLLLPFTHINALEEPSADESQVPINESDYKAGDNLEIEGNFFGSVFYAGNNVTSSSTVEGIGFLAGNNVTIGGKKDYLITAGNNVFINGVVENDAIIAGNVVEISGNINRDVIIAASSVIINGAIARNVKIFASEVTFNGNIGGNVDVYSDIININELTTINGHLKYNDDAKVNKNTTDVAIGEIITYKATSEEDFTTTLKNIIYSLLIKYANLLLVALVITYLFPSVFKSLKQERQIGKYGNLLIKGMAFLLLVPILAIILLMSSIGISISLLAIAIYACLYYLSTIFAGYIIGQLLLTKVFKKEDNVYISLLLGIALIKILGVIPYLGVLVNLISLLLGIGSIVDLISVKRRES